MKTSLEILNKYWNFDHFRPLQEEIVDDIIYGHDCLAILPTGGGKSICFQIPGIAREGLTLVISPLIALMQDQVENLKKRGIKASFINSNLNYREIDIALDNARFGKVQFLYTSPERVNSDLFKERFKNMPVSLIVIDEAHCISEWGHDFRPSYRKLKELRESHPEVPIAAFTASATPQVQKDIELELGLNKAKIYEASSARLNLHYSVVETHNKLGKIKDLCQANHDSSGIIYCQTRRSVKEITRFLRANGINAGLYHGGMKAEDRNLMLSHWMKNEIRIIVATNAFGMGIDKADVRFVLHFEIPTNIESYYQEAGRAGRDNQDAQAVAFIEHSDFAPLELQLENKYQDEKTIRSIYNALCNHLSIAIGSGKDESFPLDLLKFSKAFQLDAGKSYFALKSMQLLGLIYFTESDFSPTRLQFDVEQATLYNFQLKYEKPSKLITVLSRNYPGIFERFVTINEKELSKLLKCTESEITAQLKFMEQYGLLLINYKNALPKVTLLMDRISDASPLPNSALYKSRKEVELVRLSEMKNYVDSSICRQQFISSYFGNEVPPCMHCDNCLKNESLQFEELERKIKALLPADLDSLKVDSGVHPAILKQVLQRLILEEKISFKENKYLVKI